ncbi:hypothetical protein NDN08_000102 [Rhodosorus marinus]|uniref:ABC-2 type transporter domain-containing protein n=1 Tax=Rhodosorus marinus TaxID=101924 RepID=A0AAV8UHX6_9RHOD|nr:hypothetical protein NDN08_000102 [Rhodosorus marinus]
MAVGTESVNDSTVSKDSPPVNPELELSDSEGDIALDVESLAEDSYEAVSKKKGVSLYFKDVKYEVNVDVNTGSEGCLRWMRKKGSNSKEILHGISGYRDKRTRRKVAYVTQEDLFFSNLTVNEVLTFTAHVRLPDSMTVPEKDARVDVVLDKLNLQKTANTKIGDGLFNKGISGGERKRLLTDEDLHGTQPLKAKLVEAWKEEEKGLFLDHTEFDNEKSSTRRFFTDSVVSSFHSVVKSVRSLPSNFMESMGRSEPVEDVSWDDDRKYATSWNTQFRNLSQRAFRQKRGQVTEIWPIIHLCCTLVLVGIVWFRMPETEATINDRVGNLFFACIFWGFFTMLSATYAFPTEKAVIRKDRSSGAYRLSAYFLAKSTAEVPLDVIYPIVWGSIVYWLVGLNPNIDRFFVYLLLLVTNVLVAQSFGLAISVAVMNVQKATVLASVVMLASLMVAGFYVATENLPSWIRWVQYLSFVVYSFAALMLNEFNGQTYTCNTPPDPPTEFQLGCPIEDVYVYETYDLTFNLGVWGNWGIMIAWIAGLRLLAYVFLRTLHNKHKKA